jgi:hypothetical protein
MTISEPVETMILQSVVEVTQRILGERLEALYAIGSLGHGGFVEAVSDVDIAVIVDRLSSGDRDLGERILAGAEAQRVPLAERLSVFWSDWQQLEAGTYGSGRFPAADRVDLVSCGRLLVGRDQRSRIATPSTEELLLDAASFATTRLLDGDLLRKLRNPEEVFAEGVRATTKLVLFPVRFLYTAESGRVGSNEDAADWYLAGRDRPSREVVAAAVRWRRHGLPAAGHAPELTTAALAGVYREFCRDYARRLAPLGCPETIKSLTPSTPNSPPPGCCHNAHRPRQPEAKAASA